MIVAHEPGLSQFIEACTNQRIDHFPTSALALIEFDIQTWEEMKFGIGKLIWFDFPKQNFQE